VFRGLNPLTQLSSSPSLLFTFPTPSLCHILV
jgi:hypothetical protein